MPRPLQLAQAELPWLRSITSLILLLSICGCGGSGPSDPKNGQAKGPDNKRAGAEIVIATTDTFDALVLKSDKPVLVDFWAPWCKPCLAMEPAIGQVAIETAEYARVAKVNVDENRELADRYGVEFIPRLLIFVDGEVVESFQGPQQANALIGALAELRDPERAAAAAERVKKRRAVLARSGPADLGARILRDDQERVVQIDCGAIPLTDQGLAEVAQYEHLRSLTLDATAVTDAGLKHLAGLDSLEFLSLPPAVTDAGLAHLAGLKNLKQLAVRQSKVTDEGLAHLPGLSKLEELDLAGAQIRGPGLSHLAELPELEALWLAENPLEDAATEHLAKLRKLQRLSLAKTNVSGAALAPLSQLERLDWLNLAGVALSDADTPALEKLKKLRLLRITGGEKLTHAGIAELAKLKELRLLSIESQRLSGGGLEPLAALRNLKTLELDAPALTDRAVPALSKFKQLDKLSLYNTQLSEDAALQLEQALPDTVVAAGRGQAAPSTAAATRP